MPLEFEKAFEYLYQKFQEIPKKYKKPYSVLLDILEEDINRQKLLIRHNRFKFTEEFLIYFSQFPATINLRIHSNIMYNFIEYIKNMDYVSRSSACYPIKEPLAQINKFHNFLPPEKFHIVDKVKSFKKYILNELYKKNLELATYMCVSIIEEMQWNEKALKLAKVKDLFFIDAKKAYQTIQVEELEDGFIFLDILKIKQGSALLAGLIKDKYLDKQLFNNLDNLKEESKKVIKDFFGEQVHKNNIRRALLYIDMQNSNGALIALKYNKIQSVPISISELYHLYGNKVPQHLVELENNNLAHIYKKPEEIDELSDYADEMYRDTKFDFDQKIAPLFYFKRDRKKINLLQLDINEVNQELLNQIREKFTISIENEQDVSTSMVLKYIIHLIERIYIGKKISEKINFNTFVDYVNLLKKHFFSIFSDFEHIDEAKLYFILRTYELKGLAAKSIEKLQYVIRDFFSYNEKFFSKNLIKAKYMHKSLIFEDELDLILSAIEVYFRGEAKKHKRRYADFYKYLTLQLQAFILLAYYTGLRLNELRTREFKDICEEPFYIYNPGIRENVYTMNVDAKGLINIKDVNSFKSSNAVRRVCFKIENIDHVNLIEMFFETSQKKGKKYIFKDYNQSNLKIFTKTIEFSKLSVLNNIIHQEIKRYVTLHSLRHSYATYWFLERKNASFNTNNILLDFSITIGHVTSAVTGQSYLHFGLLEEIEEVEKEFMI